MTVEHDGRSPDGARVALEQAMALHRAGALDEAEAHYAAILSVDPAHAEVLHLLGLLTHERGEHEAAAELMRRSLRVRPDRPQVHASLGVVLQARGDRAQALASYRAAVALDPGCAAAHFHLGVLAAEQGQPLEAAAHYRRAAQAEPGLREAHFNLALLLQRQGRDDEAIACYERALQADARYAKAWHNLANLHHRHQQWADALAAYRRLLAIQPEHASARHMVDALTGTRPASSPPEFVRELFDGCAEQFDEVLVGQLGYRTPRELRVLLEQVAPGRRFARALDLGCGTGLLGVELRPSVDHLVGVDLSPRMLAVARRRAIYDELVATELVAYLESAPAPFELVGASDSLNYTGELTPAFRAVRAACVPGALFLLSVERGVEPDYQLARSGRYAHQPAYLERLAREHGFAIAAQGAAVLRQEHGQPVAGELFVLRAY